MDLFKFLKITDVSAWGDSATATYEAPEMIGEALANAASQEGSVQTMVAGLVFGFLMGKQQENLHEVKRIDFQPVNWQMPNFTVELAINL